MAKVKMNSKLPNFLIVGTAKAGTTSLYNYLKQHPEIYLSDPKEPKFISSQFIKYTLRGDGNKKAEKDIVKTFSEYKKLYKNVENEIAIGDATAENLYYAEKAVSEIKKYLGDPKIIMILRNPIDRAYSSYMHTRRDGEEKLSFEEALKEEKKRIENNWRMIWHYKAIGLYYDQVRAYLNNFSKVKIYLFEDLVNNKEEIISDLFNFLEVDTKFIPNTKAIYNKTGMPRSKIIPNIVYKSPRFLRPLLNLIPLNIRKYIGMKVINSNLKKPKMKSKTKKYLINYYKKDILKLQNLINRDLSAWLK